MMTVSQENGRTVIQMTGGDIVAASVPQLRSTMRELVGNGVKDLVLDLTHVQMVDSSGLGLLIAAHNSLRKAGGQLAVIHASKGIVDLFRTMRIHQHFSVSGE